MSEIEEVLRAIKSALADGSRDVESGQRDARWHRVSVVDRESGRSFEVLFDGTSIRLGIDGGYETAYLDVESEGVADILPEIVGIAGAYLAGAVVVRKVSRRRGAAEVSVIVDDVTHRFFR